MPNTFQVPKPLVGKALRCDVQGARPAFRGAVDVSSQLNPGLRKKAVSVNWGVLCWGGSIKKPFYLGLFEGP